MPIIERSALVAHPAERMFHLVNDVAAYPRRFHWCESAQVIESGAEKMVARLELRIAAFRTWFTTENHLQAPHRIDMQLHDGPFKRLHGRWEFKSLGSQACKVGLTLDFEPASRLLLPAMTLGFKGLADRMVNDFVQQAGRDDA